MSNQKDLINAKNLRIKGYLLPLLGWDENEYQDFKMRCGCSFLQNYMPQCPHLIDELIETRIFWQWWCNQWLLRDEEFILENLIHINQTILLHMYKELHNPNILATELKIDSIVFENSSINKKVGS